MFAWCLSSQSDHIQSRLTGHSGLGLGGIAILVLDISDRKKIAILLFIAVFTKTCELTVLLESFDLFTDLALQVPGFCLQ